MSLHELFNAVVNYPVTLQDAGRVFELASIGVVLLLILVGRCSLRLGRPRLDRRGAEWRSLEATLERFPRELNRLGFPNRRKSDS
jgi:hypothetical protein